MEDFEKDKKEPKNDGVKQPALAGELNNPQKNTLNSLVAFYTIWRRPLVRRGHKKYIMIINQVTELVGEGKKKV